MEIPTIDTERLVLRAFEPGDLDELAPIYGDPEVGRYLGPAFPLDRQGTWRSMAMFAGHWLLRGYGSWAAVEKATGRCIGRLGLWYPEGWPGIEVGWALARDVWGRGYATEGGRASLDYAFDVVGLDHVLSVIHPENTASIRVAEKLGERLEGPGSVQGIDGLLYGVSRAP